MSDYRGSSSWGIVTATESDVTALPEIVLGESQHGLAGVRIPGFVAPDDCQVIAEGFFLAGTPKTYRERNVSASFVGVPAIQYAKDKNSYLQLVSDLTSKRSAFFRRSGVADPASRVIQLFQRAFPGRTCSVASENGKRYLHGIARAIDRSPLHNDFARRDFPGWQISLISAQLAWNVYFTPGSEQGGVTVIYDRRWEVGDERYKRQGEMGYLDAVVHGARRVRYTPVMGDLLMFDSTRYHEVTRLATEGRRISMGGFAGLTEDGSAILCWS